MRQLNDHKVNPVNDTLSIDVADEPGAGGANHLYLVKGFTAANPSMTSHATVDILPIFFQNGPIADAGVNGVTHEALLAIVADRLRSFQAGPYACGANQRALDAVELAMNELASRTRERMTRGVEGTHAL